MVTKVTRVHTTTLGDLAAASLAASSATAAAADATAAAASAAAAAASAALIDVPTLQNRANHTGTQAHTTITGLGSSATVDVDSATDFSVNPSKIPTRGAVKTNVDAIAPSGNTDLSVSTGLPPTRALLASKLAAQKVLGTINTATGVTSKDFTVGASAKRITAMGAGVSTNGTNRVLLQLGTAGTPQASGYSQAADDDGATNSATATGIQTTRAGVAGAVAQNFHITLTHLGGNEWLASGTTWDATNVSSISGHVALSGECDILRVTTIGGTDTFDAGKVNVLVEY